MKDRRKVGMEFELVNTVLVTDIGDEVEIQDTCSPAQRQDYC